MDFCEDEGLAIVEVKNPTDIDAGEDTDGTSSDFYGLEIYYIKDGVVDNSITVGSDGYFTDDDGNDNLASLLFTYNGAAINSADANPTDILNQWQFDPSELYTTGSGPITPDNDIDTLRVVFLQNPDAGGTPAYYSEEDIYIYPTPSVSIELVENFYCEDDDTDIGLEADIFSYTDSPDNGQKPVDNDFTINKYTDDTYATLSGWSTDYTGGDTNFKANELNGAGAYRIEYTTLGLIGAGCTASTTFDFSVLDKPATPTLVNGFSGNGGFVDPDYILEYCAGDNIIPDFESNTIAGSGQFNWYSDSGLNDEIFSEDVTNDASTLLGSGLIDNTNAERTEDFYVTLTTDIGIETDYPGCSSDIRKIDISIYDVPNEPKLVVAGDEEEKANEYLFEYCVGSAGDAVVTPETVTLTDTYDSSEPIQSYFTVYLSDGVTVLTTLTDADNSDDADEFEFDPYDYVDDTTATNFSFSGDKTYVFYIGQTDHNNNYPTDVGAKFSSCEGALTRVEYKINITPDAPVIGDFAQIDGTDFDYKFCSGATLDEIETPNISGYVYEWYSDDGTGGTGIVGSPDAVITTAVNDGGRATNDELSFSETYDNNGSDDDGKDYYFYHVRNYSESNVGTNFEGCASDWTVVAVTIYPQPVAPYFSVANTGGAAGSDVYTECQGTDISAIDLDLDNVLISADGTTEYNWYSSDPDIGSFTPFWENTTSTLAMTEVENRTNLDLSLSNSSDVTATTTIYVTQYTDELCESESLPVYITVNSIPVIEIVDRGQTAGGTLDQDFCYNENDGNNPEFVAILSTTDGAVVDASGVWTVDGNVMASDGSELFSELDLDTWYNSEYGGETVTGENGRGDLNGGSAETFNLAYTYTDAFGCVNSTTAGDGAIEEMTINPLPTLDIEYDGNTYDDYVDATDDVAAAFEVCYEDGSITLRGIEDGNDADDGTWTVDTGNDAITAVSGGTATFDLYEARDDVYNNDDDNEFAAATNHIVTYTYQDSESCEKSVTITITINPTPELDIVYDDASEVDGTELCFVNGVEVLYATESGVEIEGGDGTLNWNVNTGGLSENGSDSDRQDFDAELAANSAGQSEFGLPSDHIITFDFEDGTTGCVSEVSETITVNPQPKLNVIFNEGVSTYSDGDELDDAALCYVENTLSIRGEETSDAATNERNIDDVNGTIVWSIAYNGTDYSGISTADNGNTASIDFDNAQTAASTTGEGDPSDHTITLEYTDDATGCYSSLDRVLTINPQPTLDIIYGGLTLEGQAFCFDEDEIEIQGTHETGSSSASNATTGTWLIDSDGLTGNGGSADIDLNIAQEFTSDREGMITDHTITFDYTDSEGCSTSITRDFQINPQPTVEIIYDGGSGLDGTSVCYTDGDYTLQGTFISGDESTASNAVDDGTNGTSTWSSVTGITDNNDGSILFDPSGAAFNAGESDETGDETDHNIVFEYEDALGCTNTVTRTVTVDPIPRLTIVYDGAYGSHVDNDEIDGTAICFEESGVSVHGLEESDDATSYQDALDANGTIVWSIAYGGTDYSGLTAVSSGDGADIDLDAALLAAGQTEEGDAHDHVVKIEFTDDASGCYNSVESTITINPQPTLDIIFDNETLEGQAFCYNDEEIEIQATHETGSSGATNASSGTWLIDSDGLTANSGSADIDLTLAQEFTSDSEGVITDHTINYSYTDSEGCTSAITRDFQVYPLPTLEIVYDDNAGLEGSDACNDEIDYTLNGTYISGSETAASDIVNNSDSGAGIVGTTVWTSVTALQTDNGDGSMIFNARTAAFNAGESDEAGDDTSHSITLDYTDEYGCVNSVTESFTVVQLPTLGIDIPMFETGSQSVASEYCVTTEDVVLQGTIEGVNAPTTAISAFSLSSGVAGLTDNGDGTSSFHPNIAHFQTDGIQVGGGTTDHTVSFTHTSESTGCSNIIEGKVYVNPQPKLEWNTNEIGFDEPDFIICESNDPFIMEAKDSDGIGGDTSNYYVNNIWISNQVGSLTKATFDPISWGENTENQDIRTLSASNTASYKVRYEYFDDRGCNNSIENDIILVDRPEMSMVIVGECVNPDIDFFGSKAPDSRYTEDHTGLTYKWEWRDAEDNGIVALNDGESDDIKDVYKLFDLGDEPNGSFITSLVGTYTFITSSEFKTCASISADSTIGVKVSPTVAFVWESVVAGSPTLFAPNELIHGDSTITQIGLLYDAGADTTWYNVGSDVMYNRIDENGDSQFDFIEHTYDDVGSYDVTMVMKTGGGCESILERSINIIPTIIVTQETGYIETFGGGFDSDEEGWFYESLADDAFDQTFKLDTESGVNRDFGLRDQSWILGEFDFSSLTVTAEDESYTIEADDTGINSSDNFMWATLGDDGNNTYNVGEDSWVYTPAFDISALDKPMISMNIIYDFESAKDGGVIQFYNLDPDEDPMTDDASWELIGRVDDLTGLTQGIDWYDFGNVTADPGQQQVQNPSLSRSQGWSGEDNDNQRIWKSARHSLEGIPEAMLTNVRFRIAMSGTEDGIKTFGFAFDDFEIRERSKNVLLETFYSVTDDADGDVFNNETEQLKGEIDNRLTDLNLSEEQIIISYHASFDNTIEDPFNVVNTADPAARKSWYGLDGVNSVLDGNVSSQMGDSLITWGDRDLVISSLQDPGFIISVTRDASADVGEIKGTVAFEVNNATGIGMNEELIAYVAIIEQSIDQEVGEIATHTNVLRKLLPDASGKFIKLDQDYIQGDFIPIGSVDDEDGDEYTLDIHWNIANIEDASQLAAVVFIQNRLTKEIYQAEIIKASDANGVVWDKSSELVDILNAGDLIGNQMDFDMYPNPTDNAVTIRFNSTMTEKVNWMIFDQSGRVFDQGEATPGVGRFDLKTDRFPSGVYYMQMRGDSRDYGHKKLIILHR
ncbi:MAG: T9SS type A sorting domain-containing protein [Reichenbachiella sp.]